MWTIYKLWKTNEHTILKLWTLIKNIIERTHKFPYNILFTFLMDRGRAPNGIGHLMILYALLCSVLKTQTHSHAHVFTLTTGLWFGSRPAISGHPPEELPQRRLPWAAYGVSYLYSTIAGRLFVEKIVSRFLVPLHQIHGAVYGTFRIPGTRRHVPHSIGHDWQQLCFNSN